MTPKNVDMKKTLLLFLTAVALMAFGYFVDGPKPIPPSKQRKGDAAKGFNYLVYGDYVRSGIPYKIFRMAYGKADSTLLPRTGINAQVPYDFNALRMPSGKVIVAPNCLQCHAMPFDGKLVIGLGNAGIDFTKSRGINAGSVAMMEQVLKSRFPDDYEDAKTFLAVTRTIAPDLVADTRGVNLADHLAALLVAHRDPQTFHWSDSALLKNDHAAIPTDTPPWWLLKKKNAMFYNGFGRGDFGRFLMASNLLTTGDTSESRMVDEHMPDLLAYIYSLQPPPYPKAVDKPLVAKGKQVFTANCASCHGSYGARGRYPNLLIPGPIIQTDSLLYTSNYSTPQFVSWFNRSWFRSGDHPARLEPTNGYVAPPLDGIWVSAPYLHNGSVPTLEGVLNSRLRPRYWSRDFEHPQYNYDNPGWVYREETAGGKPEIYNTDQAGYGNRGHYFGDHLSDAERKALIEYLKTL